MAGIENKEHGATLAEKTPFIDPRQHVITYSRVRPYECLICHKGFVHADSLKSHVCIQPEGKPPREIVRVDLMRDDPELKACIPKRRDETFDGPITCEICDKEFRQLYLLKAHLLKHTGEKPHICKLCGKRFGTTKAHRSHLRIHTGEKLYRCLECGKAFLWKYSLKHHVQAYHEEGLQFPCKLCDRVFPSMQRLRFHGFSHRYNPKYSCQVCKKKFNWKSTYARHMKYHPGARVSVAAKRNLQKDNEMPSK